MIQTRPSTSCPWLAQQFKLVARGLNGFSRHRPHLVRLLWWASGSCCKLPAHTYTVAQCFVQCAPRGDLVVWDCVCVCGNLRSCDALFFGQGLLSESIQWVCPVGFIIRAPFRAFEHVALALRRCSCQEAQLWLNSFFCFGRGSAWRWNPCVGVAPALLRRLAGKWALWRRADSAGDPQDAHGMFSKSHRPKQVGKPRSSGEPRPICKRVNSTRSRGLV